MLTTGSFYSKTLKCVAYFSLLLTFWAFMTFGAHAQFTSKTLVSTSFESGFDWYSISNCNYQWTKSSNNASYGNYSMKFSSSVAQQNCITLAATDSFILQNITPQDTLIMSFDFYRSSGTVGNDVLFPSIYFADGNQGLNTVAQFPLARNYRTTPSESQPGWYNYEIITSGQNMLDSIPGQTDTFTFGFLGLSGGGKDLYVDSVSVRFKQKNVGPVNVVSPNGGETLNPNNLYTIEWSTNSNVNSLNIEYSSNGGNTWNAVASGVNASLGNYQWNVPNVNSNNCLLRIVDANDPANADTSDNAFSILPTPPEINITNPTFGENLYIARKRKIEWTSKNTDSVDIEYSIDDGFSWKTITTNNNASKGEYDWVVPNDPNNNSNDAEIRILSSKNPSYGDTVAGMDIENEFGTPRLTLLTPQKGDTIMAQSLYDIEWVANNNVDNISLAFAADGNYQNLTFFANDISADQSVYSWNVPLVQTSKAQIFVFSQGSGLIDTTEEFHIQFPKETIEIVKPNGGEIVENNTNQTIHWANSNDIQNVDVAYSLNGGTDWNTISTNVPTGQDSISWDVPQVNSEDCLVRVQASNDKDIKGISDSTFSIVDPIPKVTLDQFPNFHTLTIATDVNIEWDSKNIDKVDLEYSRNEGINWAPIVKDYDADEGSYRWTVPNSPTNGYSAMIRIYKSDNSNYGDTIENFEIVTGEFAALSLESPSENDTLPTSKKFDIQWIANDLVVNLDIEYSEDGGNTWTSVASGIDANSGSFEWTTPSSPVSNAQLRIVDADNASIVDRSGTFVIEQGAKNLTFDQPATGDTVEGGSNYSIQWTASAAINEVMIEFSEDGGSTWSDVASNVSASQESYDWSVPDQTVENAVLRITDEDESTVTAQSGQFYIDGTTGISSLSEATELTLFPNPADDQINIQLPSSLNKEDLKVKLVSADGRVQSISDFVEMGDQIELDASHLPSGIYYVKIQSNGNQYFGKFAKQ